MSLSHALSQHSVTRTKNFHPAPCPRTHNSAGSRTRPANADTRNRRAPRRTLMLIHRQLSAPRRKSSPIHSCTYDQNHNSPSTWRHRRISIAETHACPQAFRLPSNYNTIHNANISSDYVKTLFQNSYPSNIANIRTRAITKILQMYCRKNGIVIFSFREICFSAKSPKNAKRLHEFFKAKQVEMRA